MILHCKSYLFISLISLACVTFRPRVPTCYSTANKNWVLQFSNEITQWPSLIKWENNLRFLSFLFIELAWDNQQLSESSSYTDFPSKPDLVYVQSSYVVLHTCMLRCWSIGTRLQLLLTWNVEGEWQSKRFFRKFATLYIKSSINCKTDLRL